MGFSNVSVIQIRRLVGLSGPEIIGVPFKSSGWEISI